MALMTALAIGATVAGGVMAASSQKKAATKAADAQRYATDQNAQVQREQLQVAQGALSPYVQRGNAAGSAMNALLGLGGGQQQLPAQQPNALSQFAGPQPYYQGTNPDSSGGQFGVANRLQQLGVQGIGGMDSTGYTFPAAQPQQQAPMGQTGQQAAQGAFDTFRNSTGYQFRLGEGMNAVNSGYAGAGTLQSGAAMKAINEYGQNFASNEFGNYMGYLGNQQGVGLSGASALAGVGQNYANSISANNNQLAGALGNAALVKGNNNPFAAGLGALGGSILGMGK